MMPALILFKRLGDSRLYLLSQLVPPAVKVFVALASATVMVPVTRSRAVFAEHSKFNGHSA